MKILSEKKNTLLHRKEVKVIIENPSNPGIKMSGEEIAKHFKTQPELVVIKRLNSHYGKSEFMIEAMVYDNAQALVIEPKPKVKKEVAK